jgi:hypothetical protein
MEPASEELTGGSRFRSGRDNVRQSASVDKPESGLLRVSAQATRSTLLPSLHLSPLFRFAWLRRASNRPFQLTARIDPDIAILLLVYVILYSALIVAGHGIPYVMDNNETFSALNHAYNLWHFDFFKSYGLTDEAMSPDPAAHPVVHTHQGNFPRLFAFLLFALGARSPESQIWLTAMSIGAASVVMAYVFFRRLGGRLFAGIAMALLLTDYLMFAQWQVNTYRVWYGFLLFGALLCVHGLAEWKRGYWLAATLGVFAALFYGELVFAAFAAGSTALYGAWAYRTNPKYVLATWVVQGAGAAIGLGILVTQLIFYMGWNDLLTDLKLTLTARNFASTDPRFIEMLREFYGSRNIVFFYNIMTQDYYSGLARSSKLLFQYALQFYTPILILGALGIVLAVYIAPLRSPALQPNGDYRQATKARFLLLVPGLFLLIQIVATDDGAVRGEALSTAHVNAMSLLLSSLMAIPVAIIAAYNLYTLSARASSAGVLPGSGRCALAGLYVLLIASFVIFQGGIYDQLYKPIWLYTQTSLPNVIAGAFALLVVAAGVVLILTGRHTILQGWSGLPWSIAPFLGSGALAYMIVYALSGGYVVSGYLVRLCPFINFHVVAFIAMALTAAAAAAQTLLRQLRTSSFGRLRWRCGMAAACIVIIFGSGWLVTQIKTYRFLPPDQIAFAKLLRTSPPLGTGIVTNAYAIPFGYLGNTWAYTNDRFLFDLVTPREKLNTPYLWMADRGKNYAYERPDLYICFTPFANVGRIYDVQFREDRHRHTCAPHVRQLQMLDSNKAKTIARDEILGLWAVVRMNWKTAGDSK